MGPLLYGLIHAAFTVVYWRASPDGIVGLAALCGGDGLADIVGRRWGRRLGRVSWSPQKVMLQTDRHTNGWPDAQLCLEL
jgi:phytol kinase